MSSRRRIRFRPTSSFGLLAFVCLAIWLAAINYELNLAYLLLFTILSVSFVSVFLTYENLLGIKIVPLNAKTCFAQEHIHLAIEVHNESRRATHCVVFQSDNSTSTPFKFAMVAPQSSTKEKWHFFVPFRGEYEIKRIQISSTYPFGIFEASFWQETKIDYIVYPKSKGRKEWNRTSRVDDESHGNTAEGDDFYGLRNFRPGESQKHIDWKAVARGRSLMVKEFTKGTIDQIWFNWDDLPQMDLESKLSQLCLWIVQAHRQHLTFGVTLPGWQAPPASDSEHYHRCLSQLARWKPLPKELNREAAF